MIGRTGQEPNFVQELALNGIMWFDDKQRLYFSMKSDEWKEAKSSLKSLYHNSTPTVKYPEIDGIVETLAEDIDEGEKKAEKWYASTTMNENEESKKIVARTLLCLIQKMKTCCLEELKEPLFCSFVVENLVTPFLCLGDDYVKLLGSTDESLGSKERRSGMKGRIPDLSVQVEFNNYSALPFLCEVKSPQSIVDLKKSENQHPDFIKLCNIMKDELDRMCFVTNKVVYGLLVEGKARILVLQVPLIRNGLEILQTVQTTYAQPILLTKR
ncbi:hypothetical protein INT48_000297 [Thamnidium elegans]|uniref:Uncharacterized protein n=1 Tax=Thamnidium elegans TaxID=101142 RepID=A0A8H7STB3_9FUNG|nr:hypothetical protein INT48_000297 [Thamnidium elegans]